MDMAFQAASSVRPGNRGFNSLRNTRPSLPTSPVSHRISIRPLHSVIVASRVISNDTACVPLESSASEASPALPVASAKATEAIIKTVHIFAT